MDNLQINSTFSSKNKVNCQMLSFSVSILCIHFIGVLITVQLPGGRMLSTGTASASSEENRFLRGLRTRAIPVGVTVRRATELV
ncbi:hypothetical protein [Oceanobacillus sp. AG]|uniref:hypothetical protein n=1 Tax=Oceanobacillus sp. AG TaxID=2681969 RepID=UPI0012EC2C08|nr:hypothetical protein [Oceanobacillus sp. AG]